MIAGRRVVGVIQARMGSTRLAGKVLEPIGGRPLLAWTIAAMEAVPSLDALVLAVTGEPADDALVAAAGSTPVHRGPTHDVLRRVVDAARPFAPDLLVRQTGDNPFVDPDVVEAQVRLAVDEQADYVGQAGYPLGVAGEVARFGALLEADAEAVDPAEREHVMPFLYARPDRYRTARVTPLAVPRHLRYTVDTEDDLAFARAIAARLGHPAPARLGELEAIVGADPALMTLNADVRQKPWQEAERPGGAADREAT